MIKFVDPAKLPIGIKAILVGDCEVRETELCQLSIREAIDKYLVWQGVIGFTGDIMAIVNSAKEGA